MKSSILFLLCLTTAQLAQGEILVTDILENPSMIEPALECAPEEASDLKRTCVESLCSTNRNKFPAIISNSELDNFVSGDRQVTVEESQAIEDYVKRNVELSLAMVNEFKEYTPALLNLKLKTEASDSYKAMYVGSYIQSKCTQYYDLKNPTGVRVSLTCQPGVSPAMRKIAEGLSLRRFKNSLDERLMSGVLTLNKVDKKLITEKLGKLAPEIAKLSDSKPIEKQMKLILSQGSSSYDLLSENKKLQFIKVLSQMEYMSFKFGPTEFKPYIDFFDTFPASDEFQKTLTDIQKRLTDPVFVKTAIASLKVQLALAKGLPTEAEAAKVGAAKEEVITSILAYMKTKMSPHSHGIYSTELNDNVAVTYDHAGFNIDDLRASTPDKIINPQSILELTANSNPELFYRLAGSTRGSQISVFSDAFMSPAMKAWHDPLFEKSEMKLSLFSVKDPDYGRQILAHELGHHLSSLYEGKKLSSSTNESLKISMACIKGRYKNFKKDGKDAGEHYLAEEFADEFMAATGPTDGRLTSCPFLMESADFAQGTNLVILEASDSHQSDLWRVLNQASRKAKLPITGKVKLPAACQTLVDSHKMNYEYKPCL
ncbi:MAG TPA: hypothetical protein VNJ01_04095 [Bacteriovoracaceae bacterium]|nr:hypothetical protein [Bacteriovoracaceae bacterium]